MSARVVTGCREVYCVTCPSCGVEWGMRWPPPAGSHTSPCGHLTCYLSATSGKVVVYETEMPIAGHPMRLFVLECLAAAGRACGADSVACGLLLDCVVALTTHWNLQAERERPEHGPDEAEKEE